MQYTRRGRYVRVPLPRRRAWQPMLARRSGTFMACVETDYLQGAAGLPCMQPVGKKTGPQP